MEKDERILAFLPDVNDAPSIVPGDCEACEIVLPACEDVLPLPDMAELKPPDRRSVVSSIIRRSQERMEGYEKSTIGMLLGYVIAGIGIVAFAITEMVHAARNGLHRLVKSKKP